MMVCFEDIVPQESLQIHSILRKTIQLFYFIPDWKHSITSTKDLHSLRGIQKLSPVLEHDDFSKGWTPDFASNIERI